MRKIIIETPLNTMGFSGVREHDKMWLMKRLEIMHDYTARSLDVQMKQNFDWHILTRPETKEFVNNNFKSWNYLEHILTPEESGQKIQDEMKDSILLQKPETSIYEALIVIRLNSDDCYRKDFIHIVQEHIIKPGMESFVFQCGFMWYQNEDIIVKRKFASPPFYGMIYDPVKYAKGFRYDIRGHNYVRSDFQSHAIRDDLWLWIVNDYNNKILRGSSYPDPSEFEQVNKNILEEFGL